MFLKKKPSTLYCTYPSCFGSPTGLFFPILKHFVSPDHICKETSEWKTPPKKKKHIFLPFQRFALVDKSFVSFSFVSGLVTHCSESTAAAQGPDLRVAPLPFLYYISHTGSEAQPSVQSKLIYPEYECQLNASSGKWESGAHGRGEAAGFWCGKWRGSCVWMRVSQSSTRRDSRLSRCVLTATKFLKTKHRARNMYMMIECLLSQNWNINTQVRKSNCCFGQIWWRDDISLKLVLL